ncbi:GNAT family N-acetyltransferase [Algoriphagus zhangzhouensis]|uniref:Acetyltransferase (GNAT) family protein n=1 Tax=Algoriphagus zhangzhouensis TaxID=1073327 RepID=A0A1M7Z6U4_9BACT|nr:GNAT family N-acetyltransferase [Algoriphagus zhangzhouensis]TDY49195.1 acetyltransferase (GNAT) family protein [Algoriphagus zhangzhouensis]SHO60574.1 Acetyltransferase (GNAT) family protein [Algoriphagus zhangzhouensis]
MENVEILPFSPELKPYFNSINRVWVEELFEIEPFDKEQLENPEKYVLDKGGEIIFARSEGKIVGTIGLAKVDETTYEMIKMGVDKSAQGKGVGMILAKEILKIAKEKGADKVILYTHSKLKAAISIYEKLGFKEIQLCNDKYVRCDLVMELDL